MRRRLHAETLESRLLMAADLSSGMEYVRTIDSIPNQDDALPTYVAGDANQDGRFDEHDVLSVLRSGKYLSDESADWSQGDWNGDGRFDQLDIVAALQGGRYLRESFDASSGKFVPIKGVGGGAGGELYGNASHMGAYTGSSEVSDFVVEDDGGGPEFHFNQVGDIVGANGDSFFFVGSCSGPYSGLPLTGPVACEYVVDGGTGRFDGATGQLSLTGILNVDGNEGFTVEWGGQISTVGSLK